ncbi:hypothetical protein [Saccharospirillum sp.]|uniref:hypothetical protein n=1 Tax=Saccharospirillum sp. TaxID=2033801 RepID=UPI0034A05BD0
MKAIKIASGVAVTALALAISAQANAAAHEGGATETEWSFTGSMEFLTVINMADTGLTNTSGDDVGTIIDVELDERDDFDSATAGEAWGLETKLGVVHGPFSANLVFTADDDNAVTTEVTDIVITDGAFSFGQVGSLVDLTHEYAYDMGDSNDDILDGNAFNVGGIDESEYSEGREVGAGFRYTMDGLAVQLEGVNTTESDDVTMDGTEDYGVAVQYQGEADALSYVAEAQLRTSSFGGDDDSPYTYVGAGATYTMDMITAKVGFNRYSVTTEGGANGFHDDAVLEYGFELSATPVEALSVYLNGMDQDSGSVFVDDSMELLAGAAYTVDVLTFTGEYTYTAADGGDTALGEVAYSAGQIGAYGSVEVTDLDTDAQSPFIEVGASYTQENGVVYSAHYDLQADSDFNNEQNNIQLSAAYAF